MKINYKYSFRSPNMRRTNDFELITEKNLKRMGIAIEQIDRVESFAYVPGTLYPEQGQFSKYHPCGGSFGVHTFLEDGREAWLYGRVSYDYNVNQDHFDGKPHWNFDVQAITPEGRYLDAFKEMAWHGLPESEILKISTSDHSGKKVDYEIKR